MAWNCFDNVQEDLGPALAQADLAVFCVPVDCLVDTVLGAAPYCQPGTLLTDSGSTKARIVREIERNLPAGIDFVGSHPLAGSEKQGPAYATGGLLDQRVVVVTPTARTPALAVDRTAAFWRALGASVQLMSPEEHDRSVACTSHLPHLAAAALAATLDPRDHQLTATGFRDTTRIASGDPSLWSAIFVDNQRPLLAALHRLRENLEAFRQALERNDRGSLESLLTQAKKVRDAL
jgi:prephenate dehydrogenase